MGRIGMPELLIIAAVILILFGSTKIPTFMKSIGEGIKEFKKASKETDDVKKEDAAEKK
jgi:sec-independent protein translocase protein TatA